MKQPTLSKALIVLIALQFCSLTFFGQQGDSTAVTTEKPAKDKRPVKDMFESGYLINNQTAIIPTAKTLEFVIQHRFGLLNSEEFDLAGLYAPSNIRIGLNFTFSNRLQIGIGTTKNNKLQDVNWKYALLKQTRSGSVPLSITYYGNAAIDVRKDVFPKNVDRLSYFHQLIFARKFTKSFSAQIAPSYSHFNMIDSTDHPNTVVHGNIGLSVTGRYKLSEAAAIIIEYDYNFSVDSKNVNWHPNFGVGFEGATSGHVFQVFVSSGQAIINQYNMVYNKNDFFSGAFCIGFNMTRLWNY